MSTLPKAHWTVALGAGAVLDNPDLAGRRKEEMSYL